MSKYRAKQTERTINNEVVKFPSKAEAFKYDELYKKLEDGYITKLSLQPEFIIASAYRIDTTKTKSGKSKIGDMKYTPDFKYTDNLGVVTVVEVKGFVTTDYTIRKKLFMSCAYEKYGVSIFIEVIKGEETVYYCNTIKKEIS